jgi:Rrf2 family iron-sulfur cluster assembly transcriptional regulator
MRINQATQYGILLALYLTRSGRISLDQIAEGLQLSQSFLEQVARKLRIAGVIKSVRGPHGGYEIVGEPTIRDVFNALSPVQLVGTLDQFNYSKGSSEQRALLLFSNNLGLALSPLLSRKVKHVMQELTANELARMDRISADSSIN